MPLLANINAVPSQTETNLGRVTFRHISATPRGLAVGDKYLKCVLLVLKRGLTFCSLGRPSVCTRSKEFSGDQ